MKGQILDFNISKNAGVISTAEGERFTFTGSEWHGVESPIRGMWVDFEKQGNQAVDVYAALITPVASTSFQQQPKNKAVTTLLTIFLGGFGAHKFYVGSWGWGIVYLLTFWLWIPMLAAIVEWIRYILMTDNEFNEKMKAFQARDSGPFGFFW